MKLPSHAGFVALWTHNLAAETGFFTERLGCSVQHEGEDFAVVGGPGTTFVIRRAAGTTAHLVGSMQIGFFVDDLDSWSAHLLGGGAEMVAPVTDVGGGRRLIVVRSPSGHCLALAGL